MEDNISRFRFDTVFNVESVVLLFYMELKKEFRYDGEKHNCWEMVYIDKGEMICTAETNRFTLKSGELTFHKPNEFHNLTGNEIEPPNVSVIDFDCQSPAMSYFEGKIFKLNPEEKKLMSDLFSEGTSLYEMENIHDPLTQKMHCRADAPFGCSQATKNLFELFLIRLYRKGLSSSKSERKNYIIDGIDVPYQIKDILDYMKENLGVRLTVGDIADYLHTSESQAKKLFSRYFDGGLINYFNGLKIKEAKKLIREEKMNMTQIAEALGFNTPQYFSRCFSKHANMSPNEYKKSILG